MVTKHGELMTTFQFLLFIISIIIFYLFFKQLFSSSYPKRGVDFEAKTENEQIGGITQMDKTFSTATPQLSRVETLINMADTAIEKEDYKEADKALSSALILEPENQDLRLKHAYILLTLERYEEAKESYETLIELNANEDMAHVSLANVLHHLGDHEKAIEHHLKAIELDPEYAPHYYNYANTLYDMERKEEALIQYKKCHELDASLEEPKKMIKELS